MYIYGITLNSSENVSEKCCRENQYKHFKFKNFFSENRATDEITWKNTAGTDRPQMAI